MRHFWVSQSVEGEEIKSGGRGRKKSTFVKQFIFLKEKWNDARREKAVIQAVGAVRDGFPPINSNSSTSHTTSKMTVAH